MQEPKLMVSIKDLLLLLFWAQLSEVQAIKSRQEIRGIKTLFFMLGDNMNPKFKIQFWISIGPELN